MTGHRKPIRWRAVWFIRTLIGGCTLSLVFACGPDADPSPSPALDPALVTWAAVGRLLDDGHRQVLLGPGWHDAPPGRVSIWAGSQAKVYFSASPRDDLELRVRVSPLGFEGAPRQTLTIRLDGRRLDRRELVPGWQTFSLPLPLTGGKHAIHELGLGFGYARRPVDVSDSKDSRVVSARFSRLAVVPRSSPRWPKLEAPKSARDLRRITLDVRRPYVDFPAPATSPFRVRLGEVDVSGDRATLAVELFDGAAEPQELWRGSASAADDLRLVVERRQRDPGFVRVRLAGPTTPAELRVGLDLPPDW